MTLNEKKKTFVVYIAVLNIINSNIYPSQHAQIALLKVEEVTILSKYTNYTYLFSLDFVAELPKHLDIINHSIDLINNKHLLYNLIYSL